MKYFVSERYRGSKVLRVSELSSHTSKNIVSEEVSKGEFLERWFDKITSGKLVRKFVFLEGGSLRVEWFESRRDSCAEHEDEYIIEVDDEKFMTRLERLVDEFDKNRPAYEEGYDEFVKITREQLALKAQCEKTIYEYSKTRKIYTGEFDLAKIVRYIEESHRGIKWNLSIKELDTAQRSFCYAVLVIVGVGAFCLTNPLGFIGSLLLSVDVTILSFEGLVSHLLNKSRSKILSELRYLSGHRDEYENGELSESYSEVLQKDRFYEWVAMDVNYMRSHPEFDFREEIEGCKVLMKREYFSKRLLELESKIYAKEKKLGVKSGVEVLFSHKRLQEMLEYIGYDLAEVKTDGIWITLLETLSLLTEHPFYGCEREQVELFRVGIEYACESSRAQNEAEFRASDIYKWIMNKRQIAEEAAISKMNVSYQFSSLNELLNELESTL